MNCGMGLFDGDGRFEADLVALRRDVDEIKGVLMRYTTQLIQVPSGISGVNVQYDTLAMRLGDVPADDGSITLPFGASYNAETGEMTISGGWYQDGVSGTWTELASITSAGSFAYLCIQQDESNAIVEVKIETSSTAKDATNLDTGGEWVEWSNVLLAEVVDGVTRQRRHGNFTITTWVINGYPARWTETVIGGE